jgi:hypothetical protein
MGVRYDRFDNVRGEIMAYTSNNWLSGDVITAAKINNLETQYTAVKNTYLARYSTASTGTRLMSITSTLAALSTQTQVFFYVPEGVQKSRFELSANILSATSAVFTYLDLYRGGLPALGYTITVGSSAYVVRLFNNTTAYATKTGSFTAQGGEMLTIGTVAMGAAGGSITNIYISGTSTTLSDIEPTFFPYTTTITGNPTSTG